MAEDAQNGGDGEQKGGEGQESGGGKEVEVIAGDHGRIGGRQEEGVYKGTGFQADDYGEVPSADFSVRLDVGKLVEEDRKERRKLLKETLARITSEKTDADILYRIASSTLSKLKL